VRGWVLLTAGRWRRGALLRRLASASMASHIGPSQRPDPALGVRALRQRESKKNKAVSVVC